MSCACGAERGQQIFTYTIRVYIHNGTGLPLELRVDVVLKGVVDPSQICLQVIYPDDTIHTTTPYVPAMRRPDLFLAVV